MPRKSNLSKARKRRRNTLGRKAKSFVASYIEVSTDDEGEGGDSSAGSGQDSDFDHVIRGAPNRPLLRPTRSYWEGREGN